MKQALIIWLLIASACLAQTQSRTDFVPFAPIQLVRPSGVVIGRGRGATTDAARASALNALQTMAVDGDTIRVLKGNIDLGSGQIGKTGVRFEISPRVRIITTAATGVWNAAGAFDWPYTYNCEKGLRRWFDALGQVQKATNGTGGGGVDIVCIGDSRLEFGLGSGGPTDAMGAGTTSFDEYLADKWTHQLKVWLQDYYNPKGVQGGYGYVPCLVGSQGATPDRRIWAQTGSWSENTSNFYAHSGRNVTAAAGANSVVLRMDGSATDAVFRRTHVSSWEIFAQRNTDCGVIRWDVGNGSAPAIGAGYATGTIDTNGAASGGQAHHWGQIGSGTVTRTTNNFFQVAAPSASNSIRFDGAVFYDGDFNCGVRLHNVGDWGIAMTGMANNHWSGIKRFFEGLPTDAAAGAKQAKLAIIDHIGNDVGSDGTPDTTPAAFKAEYLAQVDALLARPSKPCVLILIPSHPFGGAVRAVYQPHVEVLYQIADERDHVAILNLEAKMLQSDQDNGWKGLGGYTAFDDAHDSLIGHRITAEEIFKLLVH